MKLSTIRKARQFCADLFSDPDWREVVSNLADDADDFEVDGVRFIADDVIDETLADELGSDDYILGCFDASFLAGILGIDCDVIRAMQEAEAYEAIGKLVKSLGKLEEVAADYASADGYGHHFNGYDFGEEELTIDGKLYHVFDCH